MLRSVLGLVVACAPFACQPLEPKPAESPQAPPVAVEMPAPLPPEETPPPELAKPLDPPDAKPVEPGITATGAPTRGKLPKPVIDEKLKSAQPGILACYERALKAKPDAHGTVSVDFVVGLEGKVVHAAATLGDDAQFDDATVRCLLTEIEKLEFPPPTGGRVFLNYPIRLEAPKP